MAERGNKKGYEELSAIMKIYRIIGKNLELKKISRVFVAQLVSTVGCARCSILLIESEEIRIMAEKGLKVMNGKEEFNIDMPAVKYLMDTKQSIHTGNVMSSPVADCFPSGCSMKSLIFAPVLVNDEVRAILHLDSPDENAFSEEAVRFVELMAKGMSIALERSLLHSQVEVLTIEDDLTGCLNRNKLEEDLEAETNRARRYGRPLTLLIVDIDWFKKYNDCHRQAKGDELLKKLAGILTGNLRNTDRVYRYGGEEFAILLPETNKENALVVAERLQETIEQEEFEGETVSQPDKKITVSIGVASYPNDGNFKDELLEFAEAAMRQAKQAGRNCVFEKEVVRSSAS